MLVAQVRSDYERTPLAPNSRALHDDGQNSAVVATGVAPAVLSGPFRDIDRLVSVADHGASSTRRGSSASPCFP